MLSSMQAHHLVWTCIKWTCISVSSRQNYIVRNRKILSFLIVSIENMHSHIYNLLMRMRTCPILYVYFYLFFVHIFSCIFFSFLLFWIYTHSVFRTTIKTSSKFVLWLSLNNLAAKFIFPVLLFIINGDDDCLLIIQ